MNRIAARSACRAAAILLVSLWLGGCASFLPQTSALHDNWPADLPRKVELTEIPFHAQKDYECGPAALQMVLESAGAAPALDELIKEVYIPERKGSLQVEMLAAPRRYGMISYPLAPQFQDVLREVAAGTPVVVLQDYGAWPVSIWHYAVVAGYDGVAGNMILRSGEKERLEMPFPVFEYLWKKSHYWSMVVVPPNHIPVTARETPYLDAVVAMERVGKPAAVAAAYTAAVDRWPDDVTARIGLANAFHAKGQYARAAAELTQAQRIAPDSPVVLNNLAQTLSDEGRQKEALALADRALALKGPYQAAIEETRATILRRMKGGRADAQR